MGGFLPSMTTANPLGSLPWVARVVSKGSASLLRQGFDRELHLLLAFAATPETVIPINHR